MVHFNNCAGQKLPFKKYTYLGGCIRYEAFNDLSTAVGRQILSDQIQEIFNLTHVSNCFLSLTSLGLGKIRLKKLNLATYLRLIYVS